MLLEVGVQVDILLRNGQWIRNMQVLSLLNGQIKIATTMGAPSQTYDTNKDIAVIVKSSLISL